MKLLTMNSPLFTTLGTAAPFLGIAINLANANPVVSFISMCIGCVVGLVTIANGIKKFLKK